MASISASHVRSSSLPYDVHPLTRAIEDHLVKLTQSQSVGRKVSILKNLYEVVEDFLQVSMTHEASSDLEEVSDGFLKVLDICGNTRDVFLQVKEHVIELESTLRRRSKLGDASMVCGMDAYMSKRRALSRTIERDVKPMVTRKEKKDFRYKNVLKQVEETSFEVLVTILLVVSRSHKVGWRHSSRGFLPKLFHSKIIECEEADTDEIGLTEGDLERLKRGNVSVAAELHKLKETETKIQEIERDLECLYRKLIKTRVSLLNKITN